jgi:hypothetical protein
MKHAINWLFCSIIFITVQATGAAAEDKITVMNPRGIQPAIQRIPMAARTGSLDGKTVFIVDTKYPNTKPFVNTLRDNLAANYPKTTWVNKDKTGNYMEDDPALWTEIKEKAHAAIVLIGH